MGIVQILLWLSLESEKKPTKNASNLVKILDSEIRHFCNEFKGDNILIFRSCNIEVFEIITKCIRKFWAYSQISVIAQKSEINNYSIKDLNLIAYDSNEPVSFDFIKYKIKSIINQNIKVCFIPYNDLELHTYYNIFDILVKLNIDKVFLINLDGFIKVMPYPRELCKDIKFYLNNKQKFLKLRDLYDSKSIY